MARGYTKLNRTSDHRKATLRDLATQLILHGRIETTLAKAKELRRIAEKLITKAKKGDINSRRLAAKSIRKLTLDNERDALQILFDDLGPKYKDRNGGYTRIYKAGFRRGDSTPMAIIEWV